MFNKDNCSKEMQSSIEAFSSELKNDNCRFFGDANRFLANQNRETLGFAQRGASPRVPKSHNNKKQDLGGHRFSWARSNIFIFMI